MVFMNMKKHHPIFKIFNSSVVSMPTPLNISSWWNMGSLLGLCLLMQIMSGVFLAMYFTSGVNMAFDSVIYISQDVNLGWFLRATHANGASFFFICLYLHIGRGVYFLSYTLIPTWMVGSTIFILTMATAFLGYVLPWGQMSFWGATVITNLVSTIPYMGVTLVQWLWGGFAVDAATLSRFFALHFVLPFAITALVLIHIMFLHQTGSKNPLGLNSDSYKTPLHPYFTLKDTVGFILMLTMLILLTLLNPFLLGDPENFNPANPLSTPPHIQPEWYYLFAYAILRSIPNKLGGVIALMMSISTLYLLPWLYTMKISSSQFYPMKQLMFWFFFITVILLTWIGARPVEPPYITVGQVLTTAYFLYFLSDPLLMKTWEYYMIKLH